jgi:5-methylcytosine-specific restriction endonuclease McrA
MKICTRCKGLKSNFPKRSSASDGLASWCTDCYSAHSKSKYATSEEERNRKKRNKSTIEQRTKEYVYNYLLTHPCIKCGETDIVVLEFDHVDPTTKLGNVSELFNYSLKKVKEEISKCDVLCANCHRRKTAEQFGTWRTVFLGVAQ